MKPILSILVFTAFIVSAQAQVAAFLPAPSPESAGFDKDRLKRLDNLMQDFIKTGKAPNAVTFVAKGGKIVHHQAYGFRNLEAKMPLQRDDIFRIASQSKLVTSIAVLMLMEEGKFYLDEPISRYIPAFADPKVLVKKDDGSHELRPAKGAITIRQLLTHTAGIPYEHPLQEDPTYKVPFFASMEADTLKNVVNKIAARPLLHDPGMGFTYGLNSDVLGRLVEVVSGKSLDAFFRERIFVPLDMMDTYFYLPVEKAGRLVELYSKGQENDPLTVNTNETYRKFATQGAKTFYSGGAGLVSTIRDYARLCQFVLNKGTFNGNRLLSRSTCELFFRNQIGEYRVWDRNDGFSLGLQVIGSDSHYGDNATPGAVTWGGMYCSEYTIDAKEDLIMLVFTNVHPYAHYSDFVRKFRASVYQALR
jgi:CubicO group peptidase (beta-lactamase class C family)